MKTNDELLINTEFGSEASVHREDVKGELAQELNDRLKNIGFLASNEVPGFDYQGSMAIHVYKSEITNSIVYVNQTSTLQHVPEVIADKAFENLKGDAQEFYGRTRQTRRSGF